MTKRSQTRQRRYNGLAMPLLNSLRRRIVLHLGVLLSGTLLMAAGALWGIDALEHDFTVALTGYNELRQAYQVGARTLVARSMLASDHAESALAEMESAQRQLQWIVNDSHDRELWKPLRESIDLSVQALRRPVASPPFTGVRAAQSAALDAVLARLSNLSSNVRLTIEAHERSAQAKRRTMLWSMAVIGALALIAAGIVGARLYHAVLRPLHAIGEGAKRFAAGRFGQRIEAQGDAEFVRLADDFNTMAQQLEELYRDLEKKVADKTAQLLRSARLASVGYLAAGVAHEINNPLGIIAGYGQRALQQLEKESNPQARQRIEQALRIICDEAFRCRGITDKLLALARPGEAERRRVNLAESAREVIAALGGLDDFRDRKLSLQADPQADLHVWANEGEMKQLLLNLTMNALEAVAGGEGEVKLSLTRSGDWIELVITDNGAGMSGQTLEKAFEPFYTEKRNTGRPGTGLGLPIVQAIVDAHQGSVQAGSDGVGRGSRFTIRLPATEEVPARQS